ncbi:MAG: hypothetical protein D6732_09345 [Methanobacteriota archaeon]|nr:MAG: hypothetical protein D6732_09345 [Euryarchaeota archaeon]
MFSTHTEIFTTLEYFRNGVSLQNARLNLNSGLIEILLVIGQDLTEILHSMKTSSLLKDGPFLLPKLLEDTYFFGAIKLSPKMTIQELIELQSISGFGIEIYKNGNYYHLFRHGEVERTFFYDSETGNFRVVEIGEFRQDKKCFH